MCVALRYIPTIIFYARHLATIKSGITTVTIIVVLIALLPLKFLIGDITVSYILPFYRRMRDG